MQNKTRPNFRIGRVERIIDDNLVIEVSCGDEFRAKAYPIFTIDEMKVEDEVLLISVGESTEVYFYMLLRLDSRFYHTYKSMALGFDDDHILLKGDTKVKGDLEVAGNVRFISGSEGGSIEINGTTPSLDPKNIGGPFCIIDVCPYTGQPHSTSKLNINE